MTKDTSSKKEDMSRSDQGKSRKQQGGQSGSGGKQQQQQSPGSQPGGGNSDDTQENIRENESEDPRGGRNPQVDIERE